MMRIQRKGDAGCDQSINAYQNENGSSEYGWINKIRLEISIYLLRKLHAWECPSLYGYALDNQLDCAGHLRTECMHAHTGIFQKSNQVSINGLHLNVLLGIPAR